MNARVLLIALTTCVCIGGCATRTGPKGGDTAHTPLSDRPPTAREYWEKRAAEDRIERQIERTRGPG